MSFTGDAGIMRQGGGRFSGSAVVTSRRRPGRTWAGIARLVGVGRFLPANATQQHKPPPAAADPWALPFSTAFGPIVTAH
jgi:hypothetical protein